MPDQDPSLTQVSESKIIPRKRARFSLVWIVPIVAAATGVWIAVTRILSQGPQITIVFSSADGLEANKTRVNYNGLDVGVLTAIHLAPDNLHVIATASMIPKARNFLVKDTQFWVVKPRMSGLTISGLGTLISGYYIGVKLGQSNERASHYTALESPPLAADVPGRLFTLRTPKLGSLGEGTPILFRQLTAGKVVSYELNKRGEFLNVKIFIQEPYAELVSTNTRFWQASGIDVSLTASGLHVQTESLLSILAGGVAFETPASDSPPPPAAADTTFTLFDNRTEAFSPPPHDPQTYLLVFNQSVRGLTVGAPVQLGGITIGEVTTISPQLDANTMAFTIPVTIAVDPLRYGVSFLNVPASEGLVAARKKAMDTLVARGLRAQLKTGSIISGSLYVSIDVIPDAPPASLNWSQNPVQLPTVNGKIDAIEDELAGVMKDVRHAVTNANVLLGSANHLIEPNSVFLAHLDQAIVSAHGTLTNADTLLDSANQLIEPNSVLDAELDNLLLQGGGAASALRELADYLERHPEAAIRGKTGEAK